jgi:hypothetical protein
VVLGIPREEQPFLAQQAQPGTGFLLSAANFTVRRDLCGHQNLSGTKRLPFNGAWS